MVLELHFRFFTFEKKDLITMKSKIWKKRNKSKDLCSKKDSEKDLWDEHWNKYMTEHKDSPISKQINVILKLHKEFNECVDKMPTPFEVEQNANSSPLLIEKMFKNYIFALEKYTAIIKTMMFSIKDLESLKQITDHILNRIQLEIEILSLPFNIQKFQAIESLNNESKYLLDLFGFVLSFGLQYMISSESEKAEIRRYIFKKVDLINIGLSEAYIEELIGFGIDIIF